MAYLYREGVSAGRSTAVMISTLFSMKCCCHDVSSVSLMVFSPGALFGLPTGLSSGLRYTFSIVHTDSDLCIHALRGTFPKSRNHPKPIVGIAQIAVPETLRTAGIPLHPRPRSFAAEK